MASICCSPPERRPARRVARARSWGKRFSIASTSARSSKSRRVYAPRRMLSTTLSSGNTCRPSGTSMSPARAARFAVNEVMSRPAKRTLPRSGAVQAGHRPHQGRLSGPVRAEHRDHLPVAQGEGDVLEDRRGAVAGGEPGDVEHPVFPDRRRGVPLPALGSEVAGAEVGPRAPPDRPGPGRAVRPRCTPPRRARRRGRRSP